MRTVVLSLTASFIGAALPLSVAAQELNPTFPYDCSTSYRYQEVHRSPPGGGIAKVELARNTGNVPRMRAASNRGSQASDWYDDSFGFWELPDRHRGEFKPEDPDAFAAMPNNGTFVVRFYGQWSDGGTWKPFRISKQCTRRQTRISYYNAYDREPNVVVTITWNKPYP